jgi:hypothetical protein
MLLEICINIFKNRILPLTPTSGTGKSNCGLGFSFFACSQTNAVRPKSDFLKN